MKMFSSLKNARRHHGYHDVSATTAAFLLGRLRHFITACAALALLSYLAPVTSKGGELGFGESGQITTPIGPGNAQAESVAVQRDGKIVVVGSFYTSKISEFALARYNIDGSFDKRFGGSGKVTTAMGKECAANAVAIQSDGKIALAGYVNDAGKSNFALMRYNPDGTLDNSFNSTGKVSTPVGTGDERAQAVVIQSDGKIIAAGKAAHADSNSGFALVRYNSDGRLDTSFAGTGKVITEFGIGDYATSLALQSDGRIVAAGDSYNKEHNYEIALVRYNVDGTLDTTFNTTGKVTTSIHGHSAANGVAVQSDGKIVVAGSCSSPDGSEIIAVARYNSDGTLDTTFNGTGMATSALGKESRANSVVLQTDGKIVVAGLSAAGSKTSFALARYNADGTLDPTFNGTGKVVTAMGDKRGSNYGGSGLALQTDGKIVVVGYCFTGSKNFAVARYDQNGKLDAKGGRPEKK
jgi:uncharacterized delta-60 repeat protein